MYYLCTVVRMQSTVWKDYLWNDLVMCHVGHWNLPSHSLTVPNTINSIILLTTGSYLSINSMYFKEQADDSSYCTFPEIIHFKNLYAVTITSVQVLWYAMLLSQY